MESSKEFPLLEGEGWVEAAESGESGIPLPLPYPFDGNLPPVVRGRATLLGGPPGGGKTAMALQLYRHWVETDHSGIFITLEMTPADLFERFAAQFDDEEQCKEWIRDYKARVSQVYINPREIEYQMANGDYEFVIIDHLHELPYEDRFALEAEVKRLLSMAPAHNIGLLALAQLRRPGEFQAEPSLHDWKESGVFEQKAATTLQLWENKDSYTTEIWNLKQRMGKKYDPLSVKLDEETVTFRRA